MCGFAPFGTIHFDRASKDKSTVLLRICYLYLCRFRDRHY